MAYFISEDPVYVPIRAEKKIYSIKTGEHIDTERYLHLKFSRGTAPAWARKIGEELFEFRKMPVPVQGNFNKGDWVCFVDTIEAAEESGWSDDELAEVERRLREDLQHVVIEIERPLPPEPWPNYLTFSAKKNLEVAKTVNTTIAELIEYENTALGRQEYLDEYHAALEADKAKPKEEVIAA